MGGEHITCYESKPSDSQRQTKLTNCLAKQQLDKTFDSHVIRSSILKSHLEIATPLQANNFVAVYSIFFSIFELGCTSEQ